MAQDYSLNATQFLSEQYAMGEYVLEYQAGLMAENLAEVKQRPTETVKIIILDDCSVNSDHGLQNYYKYYIEESGNEDALKITLPDVIGQSCQQFVQRSIVNQDGSPKLSPS